MEVLSPKVILLQETMGPELEVETSLTSLLPQYSFTAKSAINHTGGLAIGWKKTSIWCTNSGGACLYLNQSHFFQISLGLGTGTNNYAELMTLKLLLCFAIERNCRQLQVYGDSMVVINWLNKTQKCRNASLDVLYEETCRSLSFFESISFKHVYREHNEEVDKLSKAGLNLQQGHWKILEVKDSEATAYPHRPFLHLSN